MLLSRIAPAGALLLLSTIAGCTAAAAPGEDTTTSTEALTNETFKLVSDLEPDLSGRCEFRTTLTLSTRGEGGVRDPFTRGAVLHAHLSDEVVGGCKIHIDPDPREYALLFESDECGSIVYTAAWTVDGRGRDITVTDHRKRTCMDFIAPARIVVEERDDNGELRTLYSFDGKNVS
jgi:hypothetical protein